jgi:hypothetical protein
MRPPDRGAQNYFAGHAASGGEFWRFNAAPLTSLVTQHVVQDKYTALHAAAEAGHVDVVRAILREGTNLGLVNKQGKVAYELAAGKCKYVCAPIRRCGRNRY